MIFLIEAIVFCLLFTLIVASSAKKDPLAWVSDYPPKIRERVYALGLAPRPAKRLPPKVLARKVIASVLMAVLLGLVLVFVNRVQSFSEAFLTGYGLWLCVTWYDALVLDCIWVCHDKSLRFPGTEDLDAEYRNYGFHIRQSGIGTLLGLPACLLAAGVAALLL